MAVAAVHVKPISIFYGDKSRKDRDSPYEIAEIAAIRAEIVTVSPRTSLSRRDRVAISLLARYLGAIF